MVGYNKIKALAEIFSRQDLTWYDNKIKALAEIFSRQDLIGMTIGNRLKSELDELVHKYIYYSYNNFNYK